MTKRTGIHVVAYNAATTGAAARSVRLRRSTASTKVRPTMFGYQMLFELRPTTDDAVGTPRP